MKTYYVAEEFGHEPMVTRVPRTEASPIRVLGLEHLKDVEYRVDYPRETLVPFPERLMGELWVENGVLTFRRHSGSWSHLSLDGTVHFIGEGESVVTGFSALILERRFVFSIHDSRSKADQACQRNVCSYNLIMH